MRVYLQCVAFLSECVHVRVCHHVYSRPCVVYVCVYVCVCVCVCVCVFVCAPGRTK